MNQLKIETTSLPAIGFNFDELMAWAKGITEQYTGLVVQADDVVGIKSEMAGLNSIKKQLNDARIQTVKQISAPIKDFEGKVKEVCEVFTTTYDFLKEQVAAYEQAEREQKRRDVQFLIDATKDEHGVQGLTIEIEDSWLNKSKPMKDVKAEIEGRILAHMKAEREAAELEQARKDRAVGIEERCASNTKVHGFALPPSQFLALQDLSIPLTDVHERIDKAYATKAVANAAAAVPTQAPDIDQPKPIEKAAPVNTSKMVMLEVRYAPNQEKFVEDCFRVLQSNGVTVKIINAA